MNKKYKIALTVLGTSSLIGSSLGLGLGLGLKNDRINEVNSIVINTGDEKKVISESEIEILERIAASEISKNKLEKSILRNDETTDPPTDGEGETPPGEGLEDRDSIKQLTADWIQIGFFNSALTGDLNGNNSAKEGSILYNGTNSNWNNPNILNFESLYENFVEAKFFNETTIAQQDANVYIANLAQEDFDIAIAGDDYIDPSVDDIWDMKNHANGSTYYDNFMKILGDTLPYKMEITSLIYSYAFMWQDSNNDDFDYVLTEELVSQKPQLLWSFDVSNIGKDVDVTALDSIETNDISGGADQTNWNNLVSGDHSSLGKNASGLEKSRNKNLTKGYNGFQSENGSVSSNEELWKYSNQFKYVDYSSASNRNQIEYLPKANSINIFKDDHVILRNEGEIENGKVVAHAPLYTFTFADEWDDTTETAKSYSYSLYGKKISGNIYENSTKDETGSVSYLNLIGTPLVNDGLFDDIQDFETQLTYFLYKNAKDKLEKESYTFWRSKEFSIELTGSYEEDYGDLIHKSLQK